MTIGHWKKPILLLLLGASFLLCQAAPAMGAGFPDGISPNHVYSRLDLIDRSLNHVFEANQVALPEAPPEIEAKLGPLHAYQMLLMCLDPLQQIDDQVGVFKVPTVVATPRKYAPRDVNFIGGLILNNVRLVASGLGVNGMPQDERLFTGKTPTDVFNLGTKIFIKLNRMSGKTKVSPDEVYAQIVRCVDDVRSILQRVDPASRYRIDVPQSKAGLKPADAFEKCLAIRRGVNQHRQALGLATVPVPQLPSGYAVKPRDVFFQTQVVIAELNVLKINTNTISSTPLPIPASGKTPTDVCQQGALIDYLLAQIDSGASLGAASARTKTH